MPSSPPDFKTDILPMISAHVIHTANITPDIKIIKIKPSEPLIYTAGQYVPISWKDHEQRYYSIAGFYEDGTIEIHVKRGAGAASQYVLDMLQDGDGIKIGHGIGSNIYDSGVMKDKPLIMIAGGIGFTPQKAMIEAALATHHQHAIHFFWGTQAEGEQYMASYFQELAQTHDNFEYIPVIGGIMIDHVLAQADITENTAIFIAGSPDMINDALVKLHAREIDLSRIYFDHHPDIIIPNTDK